MKPRRTPSTDAVFRLPGGNEDNDLWVERTVDADQAPVIRSVWEPTPEERQFLAAGASVELIVWGSGTPPVALGVTDEPLGRREGRS